MVKIYKQPFAHEGDTIAIPDAPQPNGKISNADGWTADYQLPKTDPNYKPVGRQEMNGVFKEVTESLGEVQIQGAATWSADGAPYPINAQVYHGGKQWIALRANSVEPVEGEDWSAIGTAATKNVGIAPTEIPLNSDLGTAATRDAGTAPSEIPLNSDLGTAATRDVGIAPTEIPLNSNLGTAATRDAGEIDRNTTVSAPGPSLVNKLQASANLRGLYAVSTATYVAIGVVSNSDFVCEYRFQYDVDDLLLLRGVFAGPMASEDKLDVTLSGTFYEGGAPSTYTTSPGDSFSFSFTGSGIRFRRYCGMNGGLWKFNFIHPDGTIIRTVDVSCYAATGSNRSIDIDGFPFNTYDVVAFFQGDDPSFPPSLPPSRGYVLYDATDPNIKAISVDSTGLRRINTVEAIEVFSATSIPDFAVRAKPSGAAYNTAWAPSHGGMTGVAMNPKFIKILLDGKVANFPAGTVPNLPFREISTFELVQNFPVTNPNGADGRMWDHYISHSIGSDGTLKITNNMRFVQETFVELAYSTMLPARSDPGTLHRLLLNNGFVKQPVPVDGSQDTFGNDVTSAAFLGEFAPGSYYGCAVDVSSLRDAVNYGREEYEPDVPGLVTYRADNVSKVYWTFLKNATVPAGATFQWQTTIAVVGGIVFPNTYALTVGG